MQPKHLIVKIEPYTGRDTFISCGTFSEDETLKEQPIYSVVNIQSGETVDSGYRSYEEAKETWPEAFEATSSQVVSQSIGVCTVPADNDGYDESIAACLLWGEDLFRATGEEGTILDALDFPLDYVKASDLNVFLTKWVDAAAQMKMPFSVSSEIIKLQQELNSGEEVIVTL